MAQFASENFWIAAIAAILLQWTLEPLKRPLFRAAYAVVDLNAVILFLLVLSGMAPLTGNPIVDDAQALGLAGCYRCTACLLSNRARAILANFPWAVVFWSYCMAIRLSFPSPVHGALGVFPLVICATILVSLPFSLVLRNGKSSSLNA